MLGPEVVWPGFFLALALLVIIARKSLWIAMVYGALVLGLAAISSSVDFRDAVIATLVDPSVLFLALTVGMIPMLGGAMEESGLLDDLVNNLRIGKKAFMSVSPAMVGMMPMPGGALLSAPILDKAAPEVPGDQKAAINVWYRHILYLGYPLSTSLIVSSKIANLDIYVAIMFLSPFLMVSIILGYLLLLRGISSKREFKGRFDGRRLGAPLLVLLIAPVLDLILTRLLDVGVREMYLAFAVFVGLFLSFYLGGLGPRNVVPIAKRMKPWNFGLIIVGMFMFLNVFMASEVPDLIKDLHPSKVLLLVVVGALLGLVSGRIQLPTSIIIPIYLAVYAVGSMDPMTFAIMYYAVFIGYVLSPVHPCISVSLEYFRTDLPSFFRAMALPSAVALGICIVVGLMVL